MASIGPVISLPHRRLTAKVTLPSPTKAALCPLFDLALNIKGYLFRIYGSQIHQLMFTPSYRLGRRIDQQPWDKVQLTVAAVDLLAILLLIGILTAQLPELTIGNIPLEIYSLGIGCLAVAPWPIRVMMRSQTWQRMDRPNAWACVGGVCFAASVPCYAALLIVNAGATQDKPFESEFIVIAKVHATGNSSHRCHVDTISAKYGKRAIETQEAFWENLQVGDHIKLSLQTGRFGYPLIRGYEYANGGTIYLIPNK